MQADHIEALKQVDLERYALACGYAEDAGESGGSVKVLRRGRDGAGTGDKLIVCKSSKRGYDIYKNIRTGKQGSIIDFVMEEHGEGFKAACERLGGDNDATTTPSLSSSKGTSQLRDVDKERDRKKCLAVWNAATWTTENPYLASRGLTAASLGDDRFKDTFRQSKHGATLFLHHDRQGPCGYELKGHDQNGKSLNGFMKRGQRGFWYSNNLKSATSVVICESALDCLSHYELYRWDVAYLSFAGTISIKQKELFTGLFNKSSDKLFVVATDNDRSGDDYFKMLCDLASKKLKRHRPEGKDFNADLQYCQRENS